jgi:hypothetical protein
MLALLGVLGVMAARAVSARTAAGPGPSSLGDFMTPASINLGRGSPTR